RAVTTYRDQGFRWNRNRAAITQHIEAVFGLQHTVFVDLEAAGTRIAFTAILPLDRYPAGAAHSDIQITTGMLYRAFAEIGTNRGINHKGTRRQAIADHRDGAERIELGTETRRRY